MWSAGVVGFVTAFRAQLSAAPLKLGVNYSKQKTLIRPSALN